MTAVRAIAPFTLTYALFLTFHGAESAGGGFQGGAIAAATILMIAFAFGIGPTRDWLRNRTLVLLATGGVAMFALVGLIPMGVGGTFLEHGSYYTAFDIKTKWGLEAVEIVGIAPIVSGVIVALFFVLAAGFIGGGIERLPEESEPTEEVDNG